MKGKKKVGAAARAPGRGRRKAVRTTVKKPHAPPTAPAPPAGNASPTSSPAWPGPVICAEGYVFELERRGYLQAGAFVPEVLFDHPEVVEQLHLDFVHAGSDVTQALTYYVHREKLQVIGREKDLAPMNRAALQIARNRRAPHRHAVRRRPVQHQHLRPERSAALKEVERIFAEQVGWAVEAGVDFFVAETIAWVGEATLRCRRFAGTPRRPRSSPSRYTRRR